MALSPFPDALRTTWHRLDVSGHEHASIHSVETGWQLLGELQVKEAGSSFDLRYSIECDAAWCTRAALVEGRVEGSPIDITLAADGRGNWWRDGTQLLALAGAMDVDLGFTPATNTLPIRRLDLAVGQSAPVRSAWLRFPELRLEPLDQTYTRLAERTFRYRALVDGEPFIARLETDAFGRVLDYENLWKAETRTDD